MSDSQYKNIKSRQLLHYGKVLETNDPQKLGRIRAIIPQGDMNVTYRIPEDIYDNETKDVLEKYKWQREDPYVFLPLLPFFTKIAPKQNEFVHILFGNPEYPQQNKFYIPGVFSSPTAIANQNFEDSKTYLSDGPNYKEERSIQDKDNNSTVKTDSFGVFPEPEDVSILGRGTADLILKENTALLRAGKTKALQRGVPPIAYNKRSFLELDFFSSQKETNDKIKKKLIQEKGISLVKYLIEYNIYNPDNTMSAFTGNISVYKLKADKLTNTDKLSQESDIERFKPPPIFKFEFLGLSFSNLQNFINTFIKGFNDGLINIDGYPVIRTKNLPGGQFPFYYRLSWDDYNKLVSSDPNLEYIQNNLRTINKGINPFKQNGNLSAFFNLLSSKNRIGPPYNIKIQQYNETNYTNEPISYGVLGGDELYLISHKSEIPGKQKIAIDKATYGYTQDQIGITIKDNTNSMVRGEKLIEFLELVVKFLTSHVHPFHGLPAVPVAIDGTSSAQILKEINEAYFKILNENIRIN